MIDKYIICIPITFNNLFLIYLSVCMSYVVSVYLVQCLSVCMSCVVSVCLSTHLAVQCLFSFFLFSGSIFACKGVLILNLSYYTEENKVFTHLVIEKQVKKWLIFLARLALIRFMLPVWRRALARQVERSEEKKFFSFFQTQSMHVKLTFIIIQKKYPRLSEKSSFAYDISHFHLFYHLRLRKTVLFAKFVSDKKRRFSFYHVFKFHCEKKGDI